MSATSPPRRGLEVVAPRHGELDLLDARGGPGVRRKRATPSVVVHAAGRVGGIEANMREPVALPHRELGHGAERRPRRPRGRRARA